MPKKIPSLVLDLYFPAPVGRLKRATSPDPDIHNQIVAMFRMFETRKQWEYIVAVQDKIINVSQLFDAYRHNRLNRLSLTGVQYLDPAVYDWCKKFGERHDRSTKTAVGYGECFKALLKHTKGNSVEELPLMLAAFRKHCEEQEHNRLFNFTKTAVQSYLKHNFGNGNPLHQACKNIELLPTEAKRPAKSMDYSEVQALLKKMPEHHAKMLWYLCLTGMRPEEYFNNQFEVLTDRIHIKGTKTKTSNRFVPLIEAPEPPATTLKIFRKQLRKAGGGIPRDARATAPKWWREAGIYKMFRNLYLGDAVGDMTEYYELEEQQTKDLREHAKQIITFLNNKGKPKEEKQGQGEYKPPTVTRPF